MKLYTGSMDDDRWFYWSPKLRDGEFSVKSFYTSKSGWNFIPKLKITLDEFAEISKHEITLQEAISLGFEPQLLSPIEIAKLRQGEFNDVV